MRKFKRFVGVEEEEPTLSEQLDDCFSLSMKQRVIGFLICSGIGLILSIIILFFILPVGPVRQIKNMFAPTRAIATIVFIVAMGFTLFSAFYLRIAVLVIISLIIQFLALAWYTLSYIPGARMLAKNCLGGLMG